MYTFIQQGHIKFSKSEDIIKTQRCTFELSIRQIIFKKTLSNYFEDW